MEPQLFHITAIPAALWNEPSERVVIAVHGAQSSKLDVPFCLLAETFPDRQILSFDLPEHGERTEDLARCSPQVCIRELSDVLDYAAHRWRRIDLFAVSMGAYFSLLACREREISHVWFLSPVVDMVRLTQDMMSWFGISEERLRKEKVIATPMGQTLDWDNYGYIRRHPVGGWPFLTDILRGDGDTLCAEETVTGFAKRFHCRLRTVEGAGHWFHTPEELDAVRLWLLETGTGDTAAGCLSAP